MSISPGSYTRSSSFDSSFYHPPEGAPLHTAGDAHIFFAEETNRTEDNFLRLINEIRVLYKGDEHQKTNAIALASFAFNAPSLTDLKNNLKAVRITDDLSYSVENEWKGFFKHYIPLPNASKVDLLRTLSSFLTKDNGPFDEYIELLVPICTRLTDEDTAKYTIQHELSHLIDLAVEKDALQILQTLVTQPVKCDPASYVNAILKCVGKENSAEWYHSFIKTSLFTKLPIENLVSLYKQAQSEQVLKSIIERSPIFPEIDKALKQEAASQRQLLTVVLTCILILLLIGIIALNLSIW